MKAFMGDDFLLSSDTAERLYNEYSAGEPIFDYHCHLSPEEIAANSRFRTLTDAWLKGDHYKWRAMRSNGVDEKLITGDADPYDKFLAWAETIENLAGNPLYHWTHLELRRYFGIKENLSVRTAPAIWSEANAKLAADDLTVRGILKKFNVYAVGTTDDPADSLEYHKAIAAGTAPIGAIATKVMPSFRPDRAIAIGRKDFPAYIERLGATAGVRITAARDVLGALAARLDFFASQGCRASDHALEWVPFVLRSDAEIDGIFAKAMSGEALKGEEADAYGTFVLCGLAREYTKRDIVMQLHLNSLRNANTVMFGRLGPDTGYDSAHDHPVAANLAAFLGSVAASGDLPKTVIYSANPADYYPIATLIGSFQGGRNSGGGAAATPGRMQLGAAWWFNDHRDGMEEQMRVLANVGLLPRFIGMLTDSRSFLSYPRHEYFRRVLCNLVGSWVEDGELPGDPNFSGAIVRNISFANAKAYFSTDSAH